jgi:hypothetical protein
MKKNEGKPFSRPGSYGFIGLEPYALTAFQKPGLKPSTPLFTLKFIANHCNLLSKAYLEKKPHGIHD